MRAMSLNRRAAAKLLLATGVATPLASQAATAATLRPDYPRVEWQVTPMAIDTRRPRFTWLLTPARPQLRGLTQTAFRLTLAAADQPEALLYDTGKQVASHLRHQPAEALPLKPQTRYVWTLQVWDQADASSLPIRQTFITGLLDHDRMAGRWIAGEADTDDRFRALEGRWRPQPNPRPLPEFRAALPLMAQPLFAHLLVAGVGQYQLYLDDKRLSPNAMNGHWTQFDKRVTYDGYDLTPLLKAGEHHLRIALGNGFFNVESVEGRYSKLNTRFGQPQLWAQLRLVYADGRSVLIGTDRNWQTRDSGTVFSSLYGGEDYDARRDELWRPALEVQGPEGTLEAASFVPMKVQKTLAPVARTMPTPDTEVFDFGLNHSGKPRLRLRNTRAGEVISLYPSELLTADGLIDTQSMGAKAKTIAFRYICRGADEEIWEPQFTYTGYRYLQAEGARERIASLDSQFMYNDLPEIGDFQSTDRNLEQIHHLIRQALLSNFASVLTDCPHREKLGWLEQIYLNAETVMMNRDAITVYEKMMRDIGDSQTPEGMIPAIAPEYVAFVDQAGHNTAFRDSPEWAAALIMGTWYAYRLHGDPAILAQTYAAMKAYLAFMDTRLGADGLLDYGLGDWFDIGPQKPGKAQLTSRKMTGTATLVGDLRTFSHIARRLGRPEADTYAAKADRLTAVMQAHLFDASTSRFDSGSQCAQAMALVLGLLPEGHHDKALALLVDDIRAHEYHVTAGDIGFHYVVRALSDNGRADVLHALLTRTDKPAYLQQIANGATALTEAWDGARHASQNHFMLGHAEIWFWQGLGGIRLDLSADRPLTLAPQAVAGVAGTSVTYRSVLGRIESRLLRKGQNLILEATVPAGATALVRLPATQQVREGGRPLAIGKGISAFRIVGEETWIEVGSGHYRFESQSA